MRDNVSVFGGSGALSRSMDEGGGTRAGTGDGFSGLGFADGTRR